LITKNAVSGFDPKQYSRRPDRDLKHQCVSRVEPTTLLALRAFVV